MMRTDGVDQQCRALERRSVLESLIAAGIDWIAVGCRSGGCGVCRVRVIDGAYRTLPMSRSRITAEDEAARMGLACRIIPMSDLRMVAVPPQRLARAAR